MKKYYKAGLISYEIKEVEVEKETPSFLIKKDGSRESKTGQFHSYHETFEAAKSAIILDLESKVEKSKVTLQHNESKLAKAKQL